MLFTRCIVSSFILEPSTLGYQVLTGQYLCTATKILAEGFPFLVPEMDFNINNNNLNFCSFY